MVETGSAPPADRALASVTTMVQIVRISVIPPRVPAMGIAQQTALALANKTIVVISVIHAQHTCMEETAKHIATPISPAMVLELATLQVHVRVNKIVTEKLAKKYVRRR